MEVLDGIVFFVYMAAMVALGASYYRKNKTASAFTLGDNVTPSWVVTMSIFATFVSSISYIALPGSAFASDWNPFVFSLSLPLAAWAAVMVFVPLYRRVNSPSAYTYLEQRFGPWARIYASTMYLLTQVMRAGTILYLMALTVNAIFGWDIVWVIIITSFVVMIYSMLGGIQAVLWTDAIQGIVLITGALVCVIYILVQMPEGPGQLFQISNEHNKFSLGSFQFDFSRQTFWVVLLYGIFINLQNFGIDQNFIQRYVASRSDREAKRSAFIGAMLYIPVSLLFLFIGTGLFAYYQSGAGTLTTDLQQGNMSDRIFPYFIVHELPAGLTGLLIASIFAAGMSTLSTSYNSSATVFLTDYYQRYFNRSASEKGAMRVLYISSITISILGILVAIALINVRSVLDAWWKLASVFSGGMLGLFLLGAFSRQKNVAGAIAGVVAGLLVILWMSFSNLFFDEGSPDNYFHSYLTIVFGTTTIFLVGFLISAFGKKRE